MNKRQRYRLGRFALLVICGAAGGCATVKPWNRDLLAKRDMQFVTCPQLQAIDQHVYFSKEASMGGSDLAGGGCGCN